MSKFDFAAAAAENKRKTGYFGCIKAAEPVKTGHLAGCGVSIDWYTRRNGSNERVIRVQWFAKPVCRVKEYDGGYWFWTKKRELRERNELFPFTVEGLELAERFAEQVAAIPFFDRK